MNTKLVNSILKYSFFSLLLIYICFLTNCSDSTSGNNKVTFSGTVTLEDTTDYSGVTVSLYAPVELDTALVKINEEYPNIGVQISQETEFDHREQEPLYTTITKTDGGWEIKNVEEGEYNIVAEKEGFGWEYIYESNIKNLTTNLYAEIDIGDISDSSSLIFKKDRIYVFDYDISFYNIEDIKFETGTTLLFNRSVSLEFFGNVNFETISIDDQKVKLLNRNITDSWTGIRIENNTKNVLIDKFIIKNALFGFEFKNCTNISIVNSYFSNINYKAVNGYFSELEFNKCLFNKNTSDMFFESNSAIIKNCIMIENTQAVHLYDSQFDIQNNYITNSSEVAINIEAADSIEYIPVIKNNTIEKSKKGIRLSAKSSKLKIEYNNFSENEESIICSENSYPKIHFNNFINPQLFSISMYGTYMHGEPVYDMQNSDLIADNNWWENQDIPGQLRDGYDNIGDYWIGHIIYEPVAYQMISEAGVK